MNAGQCFATALVLAVTATSYGQTPQPPGRQPGRPEMNNPPAMQRGRMDMPQRPPGPGMGDPMAENFFPPELVMQNQAQLGLSDAQKSEIRDVMRKSAAESTDLQWQQSAENEALAACLRQEHVDEAKALAQLDRLSDLEKQMKRLHVGVLIRIKNALTPDQQAKLRQLRQPMMPWGGRPPTPFGPPQERGGPGGPQEPPPAPVP